MKAERYKHNTDQELLENFYSDDNQEWIGILLQRYTMLLLGVCMKYLKDETEAKDCVQQIFLKVLTEVPKYKIEFFKSWLYMVAKNHCLMRLREKGKLPSPLPEHTIVADEIPQENYQQSEETFNQLEQAVNQLNEEQKICINLFYLQKNSYQQIVEKTGYSLMQVKSYIQNGKRNLKIMLEQKLKGIQHR